MRKAVTAVMLVSLFAILASCQLLGCAPQDSVDHACCHKHAGVKVPCLHELLEKGKAGAVLAHAEGPAPVARVSIPELSQSLCLVQTETRLPNLAGLYLRNRVLLI
jgi:hypothetical protein